jgi:RNA polymerase sigma-70 factor (TIGR02943 family)
MIKTEVAHTTTIRLWVGQYTENLYSWAYYKTSSKEAAEDLVQDTFLAAHQRLSGFKEKSNPKTWLFSILNHKIGDYHRKRLRNPAPDAGNFYSLFFDRHDNWDDAGKPREWPQEEGNVLDNAAFNQVLRHCLEKLPAQWFSAIWMKYMEEKKGEAICQELGIAPTNYWQILHRAKLQLRKCLELNWFKS